MKKILVTGASGTVGHRVIETLVNERKYEITALDLKSYNSQKKLKKYEKQINVIYGDINDELLIKELIKTHDIVIHLAAIIPPLADKNPKLAEIVNYDGTRNIVDAISKENPKCFLLFSSSISVYGDRLDNYNITVKDDIKLNEYDYYANTKINCEKYIKKNIKNYSIFRLTGIMGRPGIDPLLFHMPLSTKLEICTDKDCALAFVKAIEHLNELKGKTFNLGGGASCRTTYQEFLIRMFKIYGVGIKYFSRMIFAEKNFHCGYYVDGDDLENILHFRVDSLESYYKRMDKETSKAKRFFARMFSKPIIYFLNKKSDPGNALKKKDAGLIKRFFNK